MIKARRSRVTEVNLSDAAERSAVTANEISSKEFSSREIRPLFLPLVLPLSAHDSVLRNGTQH